MTVDKFDARVAELAAMPFDAARRQALAEVEENYIIEIPSGRYLPIGHQQAVDAIAAALDESRLRPGIRVTVLGRVVIGQQVEWVPLISFRDDGA